MIDLQTIVQNFFTTKKIKLPPEWIDACVNWLQEEHSNEPQNICNASWICQKAYEQWLYADISELSHGFLPNYLNERKSTLQEDLVLQINSIQDVGRPCYAQLQQLRKDDVQNSQVDTDKVKPQMWEPKPTRMLLITLTDGVTTVMGMEYTALPCLSLQTQPGTKMMVKRGCQARRGVLLLTSAVVAVLGGAVDTLLVSNAVENVVRRQLGLEEVETPAVCEEPAVAPPVSSSQASQYYLGTQSQCPDNRGNVGPGNQVGRGAGNQVGRGAGNQVGRGAGNQVGRGAGNQVSSDPVKLPTNAVTTQPLTRGVHSASQNLESELDDDFDLDIEAAMLEAEYAHSSAQGAVDSRSTRNSAVEISENKLQNPANDVSRSLATNTGFSSCGAAASTNSSRPSLQTGSAATVINLDNRIPNASRIRPKLSYNPFLDSEQNNPSSAIVAPTSKCEDDFDDGFSEQDLSALEEELQFVELQASQGSFETSKKIPGSRYESRIPPLATHVKQPAPLKSKNILSIEAGPQEASKPCQVSVAPQKKTLFKSFETGSSSNKEVPRSTSEHNGLLRSPESSKLVNDNHRASIKRPPDPPSNAPDDSPLSNKLRKLNSSNNLALASPSDVKPHLKDKVKNEISNILSPDSGTVRNLAVVHPQANESLHNEDRSKLGIAAGTPKTSVIETAKLGNPFTYLVFLPQVPLVKQEYVVKGFVMTLQSRLEQRQDKWKLTVSINDGSTGIDVDVHDQVLQKLIGVSVPEMRELKAKADLEPSLRPALTEKVTRCRKQLISLCSLLTVRVSPELQRPLLVDIAPFTQTHAEQLRQRCQLCLL